jgi:undecaprenyl-diphosphatase
VNVRESTGPPLRWLWPLIVLVVAGAAGLTAFIVDELAEGEAFGFDAGLLLALRRPGDLATPIGPAWLRQAATDISALGGFTVLWLLGTAVIGYLAYRRLRVEAACIAASVAGASLLNAVLKSLVHRARPEIVPHLTEVYNASFPSGHAMSSAAIYLTIGITLASVEPRRIGRLYVTAMAVGLVVLIGASRVYLGVHWPSDVLAGWALGGAWALVIYGVERSLRHRRAGTAPLRP